MNDKVSKYLKEDRKYQFIHREIELIDNNHNIQLNLEELSKKQKEFFASFAEKLRSYPSEQTINKSQKAAIQIFLKRYGYALKNRAQSLPYFEIPYDLPQDWQDVISKWNETAVSLHYRDHDDNYILMYYRRLHSTATAYKNYYTATVRFEEWCEAEKKLASCNEVVCDAAQKIFDDVQDKKTALDSSLADLLNTEQLNTLAEVIKSTTKILSHHKEKNLTHYRGYYLYLAENQKGGRESRLPYSLCLATIIVSSVLGTIGPIMIGISFLFLGQVHQALLIVGIIFMATVIALALYDLIWASVWGPLKPLTDLAGNMNDFLNKVQEVSAKNMRDYDYQLKRITELKGEFQLLNTDLETFISKADSMVQKKQISKENMIKIFQDIAGILCAKSDSDVDFILKKYTLKSGYTYSFLKREIAPTTKELYESIGELGRLQKEALLQSCIFSVLSA